MDVKRANGDKDIDYLVNDDNLDFSLLADKQIIILGERHRNRSDESLLGKLIQKLKPDYVLAEALEDFTLLNTSTKKRYLAKDIDSLYYGEFTHHWIEISLKYNVPFIGMEYIKWKEGEFESLSLEETFKIREDHWMKMIDLYSKKGKVIVVCGDTHLRTIKTKQLGGISPLYLKYNGKENSVVIRSAEGEIE
jgi:uncharacterized iron-regulated protein